MEEERSKNTKRIQKGYTVDTEWIHNGYRMDTEKVKGGKER